MERLPSIRHRGCRRLTVISTVITTVITIVIATVISTVITTVPTSPFHVRRRSDVDALAYLVDPSIPGSDKDYVDTRFALTHVRGPRFLFWRRVLEPMALKHLDHLWIFDVSLIVAPLAFPLAALVDAQARAPAYEISGKPPNCHQVCRPPATLPPRRDTAATQLHCHPATPFPAPTTGHPPPGTHHRAPTTRHIHHLTPTTYHPLPATPEPLPLPLCRLRRAPSR